MKNITSSVYTFEELIQNDFLYVDKTSHIWELIKTKKEIFFMTRPRRFGKSLTVSTLKAVFNGKKELFKGLAIYNKPYDWKSHPIIHLDLANCNINSASQLNDFLEDQIINIANSFNIKLRGNLLITRFNYLINDISKIGQVVILIDEYDKPLFNNIDNPNAKEILDVLKGFYSIIKSTQNLQRFVFITGVSKFCFDSLFSNFSNLTDITLDKRFATMLGYTQEELETNFNNRITILANEQLVNIDELKSKIKHCYKGYLFAENTHLVYNPVSIAKFFESQGVFDNYWYSTGTPTFLLNLMKQQKFNIPQALQEPVSSLAFGAFEIQKLKIIPLLLQTGYLTIDKVVQRYDESFFMLKFPNYEVEKSFYLDLSEACSNIDADDVKKSVYNLIDNINSGNVDQFMETLKVFFAKIPYDIHLKNENNFQIVFYLIFVLLGVTITAESKTNNGRIDAVAMNKEFVFIFEFKLNKTEEIALQQIKEKDYYRQYMNSGKKIYIIGVNFDKDAGQISTWKYKEVI